MMRFIPLWLRRAAITATGVLLVAIVGSAPPLQAADQLISQGAAASASSFEEPGLYPAAAAVDGSMSTRWSSAFADPQWLQIDLGGVAAISRVVLYWEAAHATAFQLQTSSDGSSWTDVYATVSGSGGVQELDVTGSGRYVRMYGTVRALGYGYSLWEMQVYGSFESAPPGYIPAVPPVTGVEPSTETPPFAEHREFQANCAVSHHAPDDPIVFPGQPGASHMHTFMGNTSTDAHSTTPESLLGGETTCLAPADASGYWMPTMYNGADIVSPIGPQVIYYKSGVVDYRSVRPFPPGLRYVVGNPMATAEEFLDASVEGWECGDSYFNADFPAYCPIGTQLNVRFQSPSCWDGRYLDTPDHRSHMAYPVNGICPQSHPVAVPMVEFKMAFPADGDLSQVRLASGRGYSFHYDFFNAWEPATLAALVDHCILGGLQCNARGYDQFHPEEGAVLDENYELP